MNRICWECREAGIVHSNFRFCYRAGVYTFGVFRRIMFDGPEIKSPFNVARASTFMLRLPAGSTTFCLFLCIVRNLPVVTREESQSRSVQLYDQMCGNSCEKNTNPLRDIYTSILHILVEESPKYENFIIFVLILTLILINVTLGLFLKFQPTDFVLYHQTPCNFSLYLLLFFLYFSIKCSRTYYQDYNIKLLFLL